MVAEFVRNPLQPGERPMPVVVDATASAGDSQRLRKVFGNGARSAAQPWAQQEVPADPSCRTPLKSLDSGG
jgi:hypothetical protein